MYARRSRATVRHAGGDELRDAAGVLDATADLHEGPYELVDERAPRQLVGVGRSGQARLHTDVGVQRGADDSGPAEP